MSNLSLTNPARIPVLPPRMPCKSDPTFHRPVLRVVVVDDHPWIRMAMLALLSGEEQFVVCGEAEDAKSAIELVACTHPDIAIIDVSLKDTIDGIELTGMLKITHPKLLVMILSLHDESEYGERAFAAGASAYLCKSAVNDSLFDTLRSMRTAPSIHEQSKKPDNIPHTCTLSNQTITSQYAGATCD